MAVSFLRLCGGGLLVCLAGVSAESQESGRSSGGHDLPKDIASWLHIAADGKVTVFTGKVEIEPGLIGLAPAVGNAIFAATGTRLRDMPMNSLNR